MLAFVIQLTSGEVTGEKTCKPFSKYLDDKWTPTHVSSGLKMIEKMVKSLLLFKENA